MIAASKRWRAIAIVYSVFSTIGCILSILVAYFLPAGVVGLSDDAFGIVLAALCDIALIVAITNCVVAGIATYHVPKLTSALLIIRLIQLFVVFFFYPAIQSA